MKTLGTTNILSGTFYRIGDRRPEYGGGCGPETSLRSPASDESASRLPSSASETALDAGHSTLDLERVTVFLASWPAGDSRGLTALQHTPDICWGGSGWKPLNLGQSQQIIVDVPFEPTLEATRPESSDQRRALGDLRPDGGKSRAGVATMSSGNADQTALDAGPWTLEPQADSRRVTFECRVFESPSDYSHELTFWTTLIAGQSFEEHGQWRNEGDISSFLANLVPNRLVKIKQFAGAMKRRLPARSAKQFVRFSLPVAGDWKLTIGLLNTVFPLRLDTMFPLTSATR